MSERRTPRVVAASAALLLLLGWIDYRTGYEFGFFIFYLAPVSMVAWWVGRRMGLAFAFAAAVAYFVSDRLSHHVYANTFFMYWETFMRLVSFVTTALTLSQIQLVHARARRAEEALEAARAELAELQLRLEGVAASESARDVTG